MSSTKKLLESIMSNNYTDANKNISELFVEILKDKIVESKKIFATKYNMIELDEAQRVKIVPLRYRRVGGKIVVQRRKRVLGSDLKGKGYKMGPKGQPVRMTSMEKMRRHRARIKAERKRKRILSIIKRNRAATMRRYG